MENLDKKESIVFGAGCFWCTEAVFKLIHGVISVEPGYSGGEIEDPTYEQVSTGKTGHVEVAKIEYDPKETSFRELLIIFFASHDPTSQDRQGADIGSQYRSVIFYTTPEQKNVSEEYIKEINESHSEGKPIITLVQPLKNFYKAEKYHKDFFENNPSYPYSQMIINPKLEKIKREFAELLKNKINNK